MLSDEIQQYILSLNTENNYSKHTQAGYQRDLQKLLNFYDENPLALNEISPHYCREFLAALDDQQYDKRSIARLISCYRSFWNYLYQAQKVSTNPWKHIRLPKLAKKLPTILSTKEVLRFLNNIDASTPIGLRNKTICECLYSMGLRVSELSQLTLPNLNVKKGECKLLGKGNKERIVLFGAHTEQLISHYLQHARPLWTENLKGHFLVNQRGGQLSTRSIQRIIKECCDSQNLSQSITPHTLRHCFASDLYRGGADLNSIKELLGHESLSTTEIYTHVANEELIETVKLHHPR